MEDTFTTLEGDLTLTQLLTKAIRGALNTMVQFRKFSSIGEFKDIVQYLPLDRTEILYIGMPKLHGTNAQIMVTGPSTLVACSKERIIEGSDFLNNPENTTTLYYEWFKQNYNALVGYIEQLQGACPHLRYPFIVSGEFAGGKISGSAAISHLDYFWAPFSVGNLPVEDETHTRWFTLEYFDDIQAPKEARVFPVWDAGEFNVIVEPNNPGSVQKALERYTKRVEECCPFGKRHGVEGLGEGIVWSPFINKYTVLKDGMLPGELPRMSTSWFNTKGPSSAVTKSRNLGAPTPEQLADAEAFVEFAVTENRILQGIRETDFRGPKDLGKLLKWVNLDVRKECTVELEVNNIEWSLVAKQIPGIVRQVTNDYLKTA